MSTCPCAIPEPGAKPKKPSPHRDDHVLGCPVRLDAERGIFFCHRLPAGEILSEDEYGTRTTGGGIKYIPPQEFDIHVHGGAGVSSCPSCFREYYPWTKQGWADFLASCEEALSRFRASYSSDMEKYNEALRRSSPEYLAEYRSRIREWFHSLPPSEAAKVLHAARMTVRNGNYVMERYPDVVLTEDQALNLVDMEHRRLHS